jgi:hypothetical protein
LNVEFLDQARLELILASQWYEAEVRGLGGDLLEEVSRSIGRLLEFPRQGKPHLAGTRRIVLQRFPFDVVYLVEPEALIVVAVAAHKRLPGYWRDRLSAAK